MATRTRRATAPKDEETQIFHGSGNVFADLGYRDADQTLARAELLRRLSAIIAARGPTQVETARLLGLKQPDVSALPRGRFLRRFSTDRLMRCLVALGWDVEIAVKPKARSLAQARLSVV